MAAWTKQAALAEMDSLIAKIDTLEDCDRFSSEHTNWLIRTEELIEEVFGPSSRYYVGFQSLPWSAGRMILGGPGRVHEYYNMEAAIERRHRDAYVKNLETARGILCAARDRLSHKELEEVYEGKDSPPESSAIVRIINIAEMKLRRL